MMENANVTIDRPALKAAAKSKLKGKWGWAVGLTFMTAVFSGIFNGMPAGFTAVQGTDLSAVSVSTSVVGSVLSALIIAGVSYTYLHLVDKDEKTNIFTGIFSGFTNSRFLPTFLTTFLTMFFTAMWTLLLVIPGIIKALSYSMAPYILKDMLDAGKEPAPTEAITKSKELMNGHKWELFVFELSFIGWNILAGLSLGIGFLWLVPYYNAAHAEFYRTLAGDQFKSKD
ncbi:MAG: DUF975 family protein [Lactobacillus delbrueckii]|jgi:uncharacterized membrane protein|nr:DUF975 family protein [Lactobacillus delbrueckii]